MTQVQVVRGSVVSADTDAIVNAANRQLQAGGGVCGAIFSTAGARELQRACDAIGGCAVGHAVITPGFGCRARYIIHAVGPIFSGRSSDGDLLASAYRESLNRAEEYGLRSVAFCSISTGIYGFPLEKAAVIAAQVFREYPYKSVREVRMYCYQQREYDVFSALL